MAERIQKKIRKSKLKIKGEQLPQRKLEKGGDSIIGFYQNYKIAQLDDVNVEGGKKPVRYYEFVDEDNEKERFVLSGRLMLDQAFDQVAREFKGDLVGELMQITRLSDTKLSGKKRMGNYEIEIFEL